MLLTAILAAFTLSTGFKSYMDYRCITDVDSIQYEMQQTALTDENGFRRYGGMYMVAVGSYWGECGDVIEIRLDSGESFTAVIGDVKSDSETDETNSYAEIGGRADVVEFIVDTDGLDDTVKLMGDCSYTDGLEGEIIEITAAAD